MTKPIVVPPNKWLMMKWNASIQLFWVGLVFTISPLGLVLGHIFVQNQPLKHWLISIAAGSVAFGIGHGMMKLAEKLSTHYHRKLCDDIDARRKELENGKEVHRPEV